MDSQEHLPSSSSTRNSTWPAKRRWIYPTHPQTTPAEYDRFCCEVDTLCNVLWPGIARATGEGVEMAMFDKSRPDGFWRAFTRVNFAHPIAGKLLGSGGKSLTLAFDYLSGFLVIQRIRPLGIFVIGLRNSCRHWGLDDCYRLLLARLRELMAQHGLPITLVLPPGSCPPWFTQALKQLGVKVQSAVLTRSQSTDNPEEEDVEPMEGDAKSPHPLPANRGQMGKPHIYLSEGPEKYVKIVAECNGNW